VTDKRGEEEGKEWMEERIGWRQEGRRRESRRGQKGEGGNEK
jgi:hypothetical protein